MTHAQRLVTAGLSVIVAFGGICIEAQAGDPATLIKEKLASEIKLTKATDAHDDIVTAGDVLVLHKDGLMMCSSASPYAFSNSYHDGVLAANLNNRAKSAAKSFLMGKLPFGGGGSATDAANNGCSSRKFVAGEKFWVTDIQIAKDNSGIIVYTFSDPYNDVRYFGEIKFPFPSKNSVPAVDDEVKTVKEVMTVQPADDASNKGDNGKGDSGGAHQGQGQAQQQGQNSAQGGTAQVAALAPIAPPPPPPDQPAAPPKTISVGQTRDAVIAAWGQPTKDIKLSSKEILVYPDMKVTFVAGKVSDVQ
jgi:hypothetical protein